MRLFEVRVFILVLDQNSCNRLQFSFRIMLVPFHCISDNRLGNDMLLNPSLQRKQGFAQCVSSFRDRVYLVYLNYISIVQVHDDFLVRPFCKKPALGG